MILIPEIFKWAFSQKLSNLYNISEDFGENETDLLKLLEILYLAEQLKAANCSNIQAKFADTPTLEKLYSLSSELFFANEFSQLGFSVSLIPDNTPEWRTKSPDICVVKEGQEFLIEVSRISGHETTSKIADSIRNLIKKRHFCVEIQYSQEFSIPVVNGQEQDERNKLIEKFIDEFKKTILTIDEKALPQNHNICGCKVTFSISIHRKRGYYAGGVTDALIIPEEKLQNQIKFILEEKAKKRKHWKKSQQDKPFLVALDIHQRWISISNLVSILFGNQCHFQYPLESTDTEPLKVKKAKTCGWQPLLEEVGFNEQKSRIKDPGIFIENSDICENISGVIARIRGKLYCLPNPFAEESINCLDLQQKIPWPLT